MKSEKQIQRKLNQVFYRRRAKELKSLLAKKPCNCIYNKTLIMEDGNELGICTLPNSKRQVITCDEDFGGLEKALSCADFEPYTDKETFKEDFKKFVETATREEVARVYPEAAALLWVLEKEKISSLGEMYSDINENQEEAPVKDPLDLNVVKASLLSRPEIETTSYSEPTLISVYEPQGIEVFYGQLWELKNFLWGKLFSFKGAE